MHIHQLAGCTPTPLAGYLKALALMRIIGTQRDTEVRGFWRDDTFVLATCMDREELLEFLAWDYRPTPMVAPWNGGSGFYPKDNKTGINAILHSTAPRFAEYRHTIELCSALVCGRSEAPKEQAKIDLVQACRARIRGAAAEWLDAALVHGADGRIHFPALLGTGGNDGRLDFSNNQMQRLVEILATDVDEPRGDAEALLEAALFAVPMAGLFPGKAIGQLMPGAAGGPNMSSLGWAGSLINPWDYVLALEGALLFRVSAIRRLDAYTLPQAAAPFAVRTQAVDYISASAADESARGEQWMPLWSAPATLCELRALFGEARLQAGTRRARRARRALDAARAAARQGTARGVCELVRFGFVERNGHAYLAVPLGRLRVAPRRHNHLLDEIELWVDITRHRSRSRYAPAALGEHVRNIEHIMMRLCREDDNAALWCELLCALGHLETHLVAPPRFSSEANVSLVPSLSSEWLIAAHDNSVEFRLAAALASQHGRDIDSIRSHCVPMDVRPSARYGNRLHFAAMGAPGGRDIVWKGRDAIEDLGALAWRRLMRSRLGNLGGFELRGRLPARLDDIHHFIAGAVDDTRLAILARGLMAVRWHQVEARDINKLHSMNGPDHRAPWPLYALFRLLYLPAPADAELATPAGPMADAPIQGGPIDPEPLRLLLCGQLARATNLALRRLAVSMARPQVTPLMDAPDLARRLAASLCLPIDVDSNCSPLEQLRRVLRPGRPAPTGWARTITHHI